MSVLSRLNAPHFRAGGMPEIDKQTYTLKVRGLVEKEKDFTWTDVLLLPTSRIDARLTSVSGFSIRAVWEGVLWRNFLENVKIRPEASHATFANVGGTYETTVSLKDLDHPRVLLAYGVEGEPLELEYGGPLRMIIPQLYGYKSCKWLETITFTDRMEGGYWEDRGYSREGTIEPGITLDVNAGVRRKIKGGEVMEF